MPVHARLANLSSVSFDILILTPNLTVSCSCPLDHLCQLASKSVRCFSKYHVYSLVTDEWTTGRTDEHVENIMPPSASLAWRRHKNRSNDSACNLASVPYFISSLWRSTEKQSCLRIAKVKGKRKRKGNVDLYSSYRETSKALGHRSHSFTCKQHHACLYQVSVHQMALPLTCDIVRLITSDKGGGKCICLCSFVCLSVCLLARLLKNTCID